MTLENNGVLLRAREQELIAIYENVPGIVFYIAVEPIGEFRFLSVSRDFLAATGLSREQVVGSLVRDIIPPPSCDMVLNHYREAIHSGQTVRWKEESQYPAGQRYGEVAVTPFYDASGRATHLIGIVHDITDREQELSKVNERLSLALDAGGAGGWDYNLRTGKNTWFGKAHAHLGVAPQETAGSSATFWAHVHENDREKLELALQRACETRGEFAEDFRVVWRDGTIHWLRSRGRYHYAENGMPERMLGISIDITDSKRAEQAVHESEQRFRFMANQAPVMIWMSGVDKAPTYFNQIWLDFTGRSLETELHAGLRAITHPDDFERCRKIYYEAFDSRRPFTKECRVRRHDGEYRWLFDTGVPRVLPDGSFAGYIGCCIDITDHEKAVEALSSVSRRLIAAQEQERVRIGRELHDDINQRLAMLSVELESLQHSPSEVQSRVQRLREDLRQISEDMQAVSHDLHSSKLEYLGVVPGIKSWCREVSDRYKIEVAFTSSYSGDLSLDVGLPLFRVLQEAVNNSIKHSGEKRVEVQLFEDFGEVHLIIRDAGKGFDVDKALRGKGLGLTSIRERIRLVNGTIAIESRPMFGTSIHVRIPLSLQSNAEQLSA